MYTRCPECKTAQRIDIRALRDSHGEVECSFCHTVFDALPSLALTVRGANRVVTAVAVPSAEVDSSEGHERGAATRMAPAPVTPRAEPSDDESEEEIEASISQVVLYGIGSLAFLVLLGFQIFAFETLALAQSPLVRPWLDLICDPLGCELPPFRNPRQIRILDRALNPSNGAKPGLEFSMIMVNEAALPQGFPKLKLTLNDVSGHAVAERTFDPAEYVADWQEGAVMNPKTPIELHLLLRRPEREVGGFEVELQ